MGIIYNNNVEESKVYQAYGLTVYGKINHYVWTMYENKEENALITIRITDESGKDIFSMCLGNRLIYQCRIDDTMDNFLYWIAEDHPDSHTIEKQVYKSLCASNSLFNHSIRNRKERQKREDEEKKRIAEHKAMENANRENIKAYCTENNVIPYFTYDHVFIIKPHNEEVKKALKVADNKQMESLINFMKQYPQNKDANIIKDGTMEEILDFIA